MINRNLSPAQTAVTATLAAAALLTVPLSATAADDLMDELPQTGDTVVVVDFTELRGSPLYEQGFEMLADDEAGAEVIEQLEGDLGVDPREDLDALVMTSDSPPLDAEMLEHQTPEGAMGAAAEHDGAALTLIRGDFDGAETLESAAGELDAELSDDGDTARSSDGQVELHLIDDNTIAIATGPSDQREQLTEGLNDDPDGIGSTFEGGIEKLGASQGGYILVNPGDDNAHHGGAEATFAAGSVDLGDDGIRLGALMVMADAAQATETAEELNELRREAEGNPMADLLGFGPLVDNLSIQQDGTEVVVRTSMTNDEAVRVAQQIHSILEAEQQLQQPMEGDGIDLQDDGSEDDGADADFN